MQLSKHSLKLPPVARRTAELEPIIQENAYQDELLFSNCFLSILTLLVAFPKAQVQYQLSFFTAHELCSNNSSWKLMLCNLFLVEIYAGQDLIFCRQSSHDRVEQIMREDYIFEHINRVFSLLDGVTTCSTLINIPLYMCTCTVCPTCFLCYTSPELHLHRFATTKLSNRTVTSSGCAIRPHPSLPRLCIPVWVAGCLPGDRVHCADALLPI